MQLAQTLVQEGRSTWKVPHSHLCLLPHFPPLQNPTARSRPFNPCVRRGWARISRTFSPPGAKLTDFYFKTLRT